MSKALKIQHFHDPATGTISYIVHYLDRKEAIVVDPVWDFDLATGKFSEQSYLKLKNYLETEKLKPILILETHVHADHVSGSQLIKNDFPNVPMMIGARISE